MKLSRRTVLASSSALLACAPAFGRLPESAVTRTLSVRGATGSIEIIEDRFGVPHIRAGNKPDAFFGQGYIVARDRLFAVDLGHRREMGRLAEAYGAAFVDHDHMERLFHFRGDLDAELARVPAEVLACAAGYVAGINARIDEVIADPSLLPAEYRILGAQPLRWTVRDLVLARGASVGNLDNEVRRARLAAAGLLELDELTAPLRPAGTLRVPEGLDVGAVSEADLGLFATLDGGLPFGATPTPVRDREQVQVETSNAGSNAWTVGPSRTATGRPILANDPHLGIGGNPPRHVAHLTAPGLDVIGGGAPGLPGIMQGHTDRFAFGRTNSHNDQSDLFILELDPADPERYRHAGGWKAFDVHEEVIAVKGGAPQRRRLRYSVHGPVMLHDPARRRATAVASVTMQPGHSDSFAMIAINLARDWNGLKEAFKLHPSPTNFHYADIDGNHGWQVIGHVAERRGDNFGLLPVPGDGRYDWTGVHGAEKLPNAYNPAKGWFASANQNNLPADFATPPGFSFRPTYRYDRIAEVLERQPKHKVADSVALQHDLVSIPARNLIPLIPSALDGNGKAAAELLRGWDCQVTADSAAAVVFELWWTMLGKSILDAIVPATARALITTLDAEVLLTLMRAPDARFGATPAARTALRDRLMSETLGAAWTDAGRRLGADPRQWRWGTLHKVRIVHPLASRVPAIAAAFPPIEGGESGGDSFTVEARWPAGGNYRVSGGASYLQVIDVGNWDSSVYLNLPGQSADPASPHYRDLYAPWVAGEMQPMPFSRSAVTAAMRTRTVLTPAS